MTKPNAWIAIMGIAAFCAAQSASAANHSPQFRGPGGSCVRTAEHLWAFGK